VLVLQVPQAQLAPAPALALGLARRPLRQAPLRLPPHRRTPVPPTRSVPRLVQGSLPCSAWLLLC
ncbi:hypothetical protein LTR95_019169, partial [Oleoguttula sp. CCFEE 5521]